MIDRAARLGCALSCLLAATAHADASRAKHKHRPPPSAAKEASSETAPSQAPPLEAPPPSAAGASSPAAPPPDDKPKAEPAPSLPAGHEPALSERVEPRDGVRTGQLVQLEVGASVPVGDDVTIAEQSFEPFEVHKKSARVEPPKDGKQRFVFNLELLALEPGDKPIPAIELRVVTKDNFIGGVKTDSVPYKIRSLVANEPNAQPKTETKPVTVLQDNWLPIYLGIGLLAVAAVAGLTLLVSRWLRARQKAAIPPPPPRPPWEIAIEKLGELRRQKQAMLDAGQGALFVDQLCNVIRAYLGGRYAFDGLETTTDEMLMQLRSHGAALGFTQEVGQFLGRCDLVKFAKVEPDGDEVDLLFAKAQDLVQFSEPEPAAKGGGPGASASTNAAPRPSLAPQEPTRVSRPVIGERQP